VVFLITACTFLWSALMLAPLSPGSRAAAHARVAAPARRGNRRFRAIAKDPRLRLVVGLFSAQTLVNGAFGVLITVSAFDLLDLGASGVGYLNAAVGVGGIVGGSISLALLSAPAARDDLRRRRRRDRRRRCCSSADNRARGRADRVRLIGFANIICDVSGFTILQRGTPSEVLARVFGVLHSLIYATVAAGAVIAPVLVNAFGVPLDAGRRRLAAADLGDPHACEPGSDRQ
jgi:hypothetical protein